MEDATHPHTLLVTLAAVLSQPISAQAQSERYDALANSPMVENRPTPETAKLLKDELQFQRATQTYLWALPLINTLGMKFGSEKVLVPATTSCRSGRSAWTPIRW